MKNRLEIDQFGNKRSYKDDLLHRKDGPAIEYVNGDKYWYFNEKLHRENGPAIEYASGNKLWYLDGKRIFCKDNEEFLKIVKYKFML